MGLADLDRSIEHARQLLGRKAHVASLVPILNFKYTEPSSEGGCPVQKYNWKSKLKPEETRQLRILDQQMAELKTKSTRAGREQLLLARAKRYLIQSRAAQRVKRKIGQKNGKR
jgi:uncharacterized protein YcaQ